MQLGEKIQEQEEQCQHCLYARDLGNVQKNEAEEVRRGAIHRGLCGERREETHAEKALGDRGGGLGGWSGGRLNPGNKERESIVSVCSRTAF